MKGEKTTTTAVFAAAAAAVCRLILAVCGITILVVIGAADKFLFVSSSAVESILSDATSTVHDDIKLDSERSAMDGVSFPPASDAAAIDVGPGRTKRRRMLKDAPSVFSDAYNSYRLDTHAWTLRSDDGVYQNIPAHVPGDILTDLQMASIINDPFYDNNFLDERHVWMGDKKIFSNGTSCYNSYSDENGTLFFLKEEYRIPHLERRTRTWIYQTSFFLQNHKVKPASFHDIDDEHSSILRQTIRKIKEASQVQHLLVIEGIKMGASVAINGFTIGNVTNQFLRRIFPLPQSILNLEHENFLAVSFDPEIDTHGRFMACSGGWDWAPYSMAAEASCSSRRVLSFGIFKPIYIVQINKVVIVHVIPKVRFVGNPLIHPLLGGKFQLDVHVHLQVAKDNSHFLRSSSYCGEVVLRTPIMKDQIKTLQDCNIGNSSSSDIFLECVITWRMDILSTDVELWWPHGSGDQKLYTIAVMYRDICQGSSSKWIKRHIGFRSIALVTHKEDHNIPNEGTGTHGMYFRINGRALWVRGANVVPMSQLEGRLTDKGHVALVRSAIAANMNMLRVWGGGMIMPQSFYNACDRLGVMLYHDLMFVEEQYHAAEETNDVEDEIRFIIRTLLPHPSIILWNSCNECSRSQNITGDIYSQFILPIVAQEDDTRPIWGSSPSAGFATGVFGQDGLPNGNKLDYLTETNMNLIEVHGPYNHGASKSFSAVNGHFNGSIYKTQTPFQLSRHQIGLSYTNQFVSEFGASVFSTFESMHISMSRKSWGLHGDTRETSNCTAVYGNANECFGNNVLVQRNYPCDNHIEAYFAKVNLNMTGEEAFRAQLFQCMISQMLWMKGTIETLRSQNSYGTLIWQLNDNWPTGSWGLVEYGSCENEKGQVLGGRSKPLMYLLKRSIFRDVFATCGVSSSDEDIGRCFIRNSGNDKFSGFAIATIWFFTGEFYSRQSFHFVLEPHDSIAYFKLELNIEFQNSTFVLLHVVDDQHMERMGQHVVIWNTPRNLYGLPKDPGLAILSVVDLDNGNFEILLGTDKVAFFIYLASSMQGTFEDNAFCMLSGSTKRIVFMSTAKPSHSIGSNTTDLFSKTLRIEHLAYHLSH
eukprot:CAMPEP_0176484278 /NCGR_PEP_ID=MMETSP0200_2-20121128/4368_1 /TAXON_ID=947934 /ORGANISM="Chaetoceros sp., Strain GSL56" /LENGTH=1096 /DNA_ID=CAMNT_0017880739 /DNA_START=316 /DNA_END=3606 /DNA_ORIENTATION=-